MTGLRQACRQNRAAPSLAGGARLSLVSTWSRNCWNNSNLLLPSLDFPGKDRRVSGAMARKARESQSDIVVSRLLSGDRGEIAANIADAMNSVGMSATV